MKVSIVLITILFCSSAWAQTAQSSYEDGLEAFQAERYDDAIKHFEVAYKLAPRAVLVYNISVAHGRLGNFAEAVKHGELAELQGLESPEQEKNRARLLAWRIVQLSSKFKPTPVVSDPIVSDSPEIALAETRPRPKTGWWIAGGATLAVGVVGGIVWGISERSLRDDVTRFDDLKSSEPARANQLLREEIQPTQTIARIGSVITFAASGLGLGLLIYALIPNNDSVRATERGIGIAF